MSLGAIRTGLATLLDTIEGLTVYRNQPEGIPNVPAAIICHRQPSGDYGETSGDTVRHELAISIVVGIKQSLEAAQDDLDTYISKDEDEPHSIWRLIDENPTLDNSAQNSHLMRYEEYGDRSFGDAPMLGVDFVLEVWE